MLIKTKTDCFVYFLKTVDTVDLWLLQPICISYLFTNYIVSYFFSIRIILLYVRLAIINH